MTIAIDLDKGQAEDIIHMLEDYIMSAEDKVEMLTCDGPEDEKDQQYHEEMKALLATAIVLSEQIANTLNNS